MDVRSLALGVLIGTLLGWVLAGMSDTGVGSTPRARDTEVPPQAENGPRLEPAPAGSEDPVPRTPSSEVLDSLRNAEPRGLAQVVTDAKRPLTKGEVDFIAARLTRAKEDRDWRAYRDCLQALAWAKHPLAQRILLDLMADPAVRFHDRVGAIFKEALLESEHPGIAEAARMRFEQQIAAGETSWVAGDGWFELMAQHGDQRLIMWLEKAATTGQLDHSMRRALARSTNPAATELVLRQLRDEGRWASWRTNLSEFASANPDAAYKVIRDEIKERLGGSRLRHEPDLSQLMRMLGLATTAETLKETADLLQGVVDPMARISAVYAVSPLVRRGFDAAGLQEVIDGPTQVLAGLQADSRDAAQLATKARYAIEYNRITWCEDSARVLDAAADRLAVALAPHGEMREIAAKIRTHLASEWR